MSADTTIMLYNTCSMLFCTVPLVTMLKSYVKTNAQVISKEFRRKNVHCFNMVRHPTDSETSIIIVYIVICVFVIVLYSVHKKRILPHKLLSTPR